MVEIYFRGKNIVISTCFNLFVSQENTIKILDGRHTCHICHGQVSEAAPVVSGAKVLFSERAVEIDSSAEQLTFQVG